MENPDVTPRTPAAASEPPERRLGRLPAPEVAARIAAGHAVLLPLGSTETHGPAAPMGDFLLAEAVALRIAEAAGDALVAPALPFGGADVFADTPGALSLGTDVLAAALGEMLAALHRHGARRIVLVNGHGGSVPAIETATRLLRERTGRAVPALHLWRVASALLPALGADPRAAGHGGDPVLSVALHLLPESCRPALLAPRAPAGRVAGLPVSGFGTAALPDGTEIALPATIEEIAPGGVAAADPRGCSAELGARIVARLAAAGALLLDRMEEFGR